MSRKFLSPTEDVVLPGFSSQCFSRSNYGTADKQITAMFFSLDGNRWREVMRVHPVAPNAVIHASIISPLPQFLSIVWPAKRSCDKKRATIVSWTNCVDRKASSSRHQAQSPLRSILALRNVLRTQKSILRFSAVPQDPCNSSANLLISRAIFVKF